MRGWRCQREIALGRWNDHTGLLAAFIGVDDSVLPAIWLPGNRGAVGAAQTEEGKVRLLPSDRQALIAGEDEPGVVRVAHSHINDHLRRGREQMREVQTKAQLLGGSGGEAGLLG